MLDLWFDPDLKINTEEMTSFFEKELLVVLNEVSNDDTLTRLFYGFPQATNIVFDVSETADGSGATRKISDDKDLDCVFEPLGKVTEYFVNFLIKTLQSPNQLFKANIKI
ncbi:unnamed protein product [Ambrosiozyma monospora]|uniref:Unnamed protein product n=1 Tax=Ambrosiozyma monospora TaxID=43982 RepID=A0ACB5TBN6_AMBMO|nr:unnamed protein product [Ambrosiozyma monospora]